MHLKHYKEVLAEYSSEHTDSDDKRYLSEDAKEWKHWFDGFTDPIGNVRSWLISGVFLAEYAAYLDEHYITPDIATEFQVWLGDRVDSHFTEYTPAAVKRAIAVWKESGRLGDVMEKLGAGSYYA